MLLQYCTTSFLLSHKIKNNTQIRYKKLGLFAWGFRLQEKEYRAGIFKQSMGARNRVRIGVSYRPGRLHRLAEFIPWNRFLSSINL
jgi:hypothetical protein